MNLPALFLQRHTVLYDFYLKDFWEHVPAEQMRQRPHPRVNSVVWNMWHVARVEDAGLNRLVMDNAQVLDDGDWATKMNVPWRHHGTNMTFAEVDELSQRVDLAALREYMNAVQARTQTIVQQIHQVDLEATLTRERVEQVVVAEGLSHSRPEELVQNYTGWAKGRCLMSFGLTHGFQHAGEIGVIAGLLGVEFE